MNDRVFSVRRAVPADAQSMVLLLQEIAAERMFTAITEPWSAAQQENHISGLSPRELIQVAEGQEGNVIGYQVLELWAPSLASMAHVGQIGTFVGADWRSCGVGRRLFRLTHDFAAAHGYSKFVIQVRSGNNAAQSFYKQLGFEQCGRLKRQVRVNGVEEDEILMELFL